MPFVMLLTSECPQKLFKYQELGIKLVREKNQGISLRKLQIAVGVGSRIHYCCLSHSILFHYNPCSLSTEDKKSLQLEET